MSYQKKYNRNEDDSVDAEIDAQVQENERKARISKRSWRGVVEDIDYDQMAIFTETDHALIYLMPDYDFQNDGEMIHMQIQFSDEFFDLKLKRVISESKKNDYLRTINKFRAEKRGRKRYQANSLAKQGVL